MIAPAVFAFGLVAFGFLGMGPVTIAVDSLRPGHRQRPVGLRALDDRDASRTSRRRSRRTSASTPNFERAKELLEENDGAGNTFKATAKPVLIGTAVVGATTMIFSIIMALTDGLDRTVMREPLDPAPAVPARPDHRRRDDLLVHRRLDAGGDHRRLPRGGVHQGQHQARGRPPRPRSRTARRSWRSAPSTRRRACSTSSSASSSSTLAFAFFEPFFFIGYLISIALFGLYQAIFMANAGGAWDNAKKIVEIELKAKGTPLHDADRRRRHRGRSVQGHLVGGDEPDHQVHHAVRPAGRRARRVPDRGAGRRPHPRSWPRSFFAVSRRLRLPSFYGMRIESQ